MSPFFGNEEPRTIGEIINIYIEELLFKWFKFFDIPIETLPYAVCLALKNVESKIGERYFAPANGIDPYWEAEDDAYDDTLLDAYSLLDGEPVTFERLVEIAYNIVGFETFYSYFCESDISRERFDQYNQQERDDTDEESGLSET